MLYSFVAERVLENICEELAIAEVVLVDYTGTKSELRRLEAAQRTITRSEEFLLFMARISSAIEKTSDI